MGGSRISGAALGGVAFLPGPKGHIITPQANDLAALFLEGRISVEGCGGLKATYREGERYSSEEVVTTVF
ncbi:hypothetical protein L2E82_04105 [Cichorium intybus]|uniref:Uncharacterized protein n=1 Tax=Cichorium intybus TaxID=13427 RepID=A0ACB9H4M4_CICIN|nr:hypothetical protein L2E82_04105 [Cichorium intybus]